SNRATSSISRPPKLSAASRNHVAIRARVHPVSPAFLTGGMSLDDIQRSLLASYEKHGGINHLDGVNLPAQSSVNQIAVDCMHLLFPGFFEDSSLTKQAAAAHVGKLLAQLEKRLETEIEKCLRFASVPGAAASAR